MTKVIMNKTQIEGSIRVGFNDQGFRLLSFRRLGIAEEGLALVFRQKDATKKSIQRIRGLVQDFERIHSMFSENPRRAELVDQMERIMKKLCGKIGQLERLANAEGNSEEAVLARKALRLIGLHCGVAVFAQRAERIMGETPQAREQRQRYAERIFF